MKAYFSALIVAALLLICPNAHSQNAEQVLREAGEALGGLDALRALSSVRLEGLGHEFILGAFVREDGPKPVEYDQFSELRDLDDERWRFTKTLHLAVEPQGRTMVVQADAEAAAMLFAGRSFPASEGNRLDAREALALAPERVILTALAHQSRLLGDTLLYGKPHTVVQFDWEAFDVRLYLSEATHLPTQVETRGPRAHDFSWRMWGDMVQRVIYYNWALEANGLRYPRQWDVSRNGQPYLSRLITDLTFDAPAPPDSFAISDEVRAAFVARRDAPIMLAPPNRPAQEVAPGVWTIPGMFTALAVEQTDGVVIVETPVEPAYGRALLAEAETRFPHRPIQAAVVAASAWTQFGGVQPFTERDIPVYANRALVSVLERLGNTATADVRAVATEGAWVGTGDNRMQLVPVSGEQGGDGLLVYFPTHRLLYTSSLLIPQGASPTHWPQRISEIQATIAHHQLAVDTVFSMFFPPTPWADLLEQAGL